MLVLNGERLRCVASVGLALALGLVVSAASPQDRSPVLVSPDRIEWVPISPKLPPGGLVAVLSGDPSEPGLPYVFRAKLPDGYAVPPHWHPSDENVTVLQGVFVLGFGERVEEGAMQEFHVGSYVTLPRRAPHFNRMKGETILQFHGIGPYDIVYVDPADDPRAQATP